LESSDINYYKDKIDEVEKQIYDVQHSTQETFWDDKNREYTKDGYIEWLWNVIDEYERKIEDLEDRQN